MMDCFTRHVLFNIVFCFISLSYGWKPHASFQRCSHGDNECYKQFIMDTIKNPERCPGLRIPCLNPYVVPRPFERDTVHITSILSGKMYWYNMIVYGMDDMKIEEMRGFQYHAPHLESYMRLYFPKGYATVDTKPQVQLLNSLINLHTNGRGIIHAENVVVEIFGNGALEERGGEEFMCLQNFTIKIKKDCQVDFNFNYPNHPKLLGDMMNRVMSAHWRMFDTEIDEFVREIVESIIPPLFNDVAIRDLVDVDSNCEQL